MEIDALAPHPEHAHHCMRSSMRAKLFKLAVVGAIFAAGFWWLTRGQGLVRVCVNG